MDGDCWWMVPGHSPGHVPHTAPLSSHWSLVTCFFLLSYFTGPSKGSRGPTTLAPSNFLVGEKQELEKGYETRELSIL